MRPVTMNQSTREEYQEQDTTPASYDGNPRRCSLNIYKNAAALRIDLIKMESDNKGYPKAGGFLFRFARSGGDGRKYDWDNSIYFMLGAMEVIKFCTMISKNTQIQMYHDPDKGRENEGTRAKTLYCGESDKGKFLNVSMGENKIGIALSLEEIETIITLMKSALRECFGW